MQLKYRVIKDIFLNKYYIAQRKYPFWPFWISINTTKLPHLGCQKWHRDHNSAVLTCHEYASGKRWSLNSSSSEDGTYPCNLGKLP